MIIARGNAPVARLAPLDVQERRRAAIEAIKAERGRGKIEPITIEEIIAWKHEGRRY